MNELIKKRAQLLMRLPFTRAVYLVGSHARQEASPKSDIDVVLVVKDGYVWLAHAIFFAVTSVLGIRRTRRRRSNTICANAVLAESKGDAYCARSHDTPLLITAATDVSLLEKLLCASGIARLGETAAKAASSRYVTQRIAPHLGTTDAFLHLSRSHIEYYPPRKKAVPCAHPAAHGKRVDKVCLRCGASV